MSGATTLDERPALGDILHVVGDAMAIDPDVNEYAGAVVAGMARLLGHCDLAEAGVGEVDRYTAELVEKFVLFSLCRTECEVGGSRADYCVSNVMPAMRCVKIRLRDDEGAREILHEMRVGIWGTALDPRRMFWELSQAGVPIGRH